MNKTQQKTVFYGILLLCAGTILLLAMQLLHTKPTTASFSHGVAIQDCSLCHSGGDTPEVTINGPAKVAPGSTNLYELVITGGAAVNGGFNISASDFGETLAVSDIDEYVQVMSGLLTHTEPKPFTDNEVTFTFEWTAPEEETEITLSGSGNSTNGNGATSGDGYNSTTFDISVSSGMTVTETVMPTEVVPPVETIAPTETIIPTAVPIMTSADLSFETVIDTGLDKPTAIVNAGDDRLFVAQQDGQIHLIENGVLIETPFLDLSGTDLLSSGHSGLIGLAFHPEYQVNGTFFVHYIAETEEKMESRISRFTVSADANLADADSEEVILQFDQPTASNNGAEIIFGEDGYLYISSGYGDGGNDPEIYGQRTDTLLGKILRIDVDNTALTPSACNTAETNLYAIPDVNPYDGDGECAEIYTVGNRNPWRLHFAPDGGLFIANPGHALTEQLNYIPADSEELYNFQWPCSVDNACDDAQALHSPIFTYSRTEADPCSSIVGGGTYLGDAESEFYGVYIFSDFCLGTFWAVENPTDPTVYELETSEALIDPVAFGSGYDGTLYVATYGSQGTATIYQITAATELPTITQTIFIPIAYNND